MSSALTLGSQYQFTATITQNGAVWNLTGATVKLYFKRPDGSMFSQTATVSNAAAGQVYYNCTTSDLNQTGNWTRSWQITTSGGVVDYTVPIQFTVVAAP